MQTSYQNYEEDIGTLSISTFNYSYTDWKNRNISKMVRNTKLSEGRQTTGQLCALVVNRTKSTDSIEASPNNTCSNMDSSKNLEFVASLRGRFESCSYCWGIFYRPRLIVAATTIVLLNLSVQHEKSFVLPSLVKVRPSLFQIDPLWLYTYQNLIWYARTHEINREKSKPKNRITFASNQFRSLQLFTELYFTHKK